jgi:hypothetical protein
MELWVLRLGCVSPVQGTRVNGRIRHHEKPRNELEKGTNGKET